MGDDELEHPWHDRSIIEKIIVKYNTPSKKLGPSDIAGLITYIRYTDRTPTAEVEKFAYWLSEQPGCRLYKDDISDYLAGFQQRDNMDKKVRAAEPSVSPKAINETQPDLHIVDKKQRDAAIESEACDYADRAFTSELACNDDFYGLSKTSYQTGTNSAANAEFIVRRAVELARKTKPFIFEEDACNKGPRIPMYSADEILAEILKELEG